MSRGYLLVQVEGARYGLPLGPVLQVDDLGQVLEVPRVLPAMRGLTPLGGRDSIGRCAGVSFSSPMWVLSSW